MTDDQLSRLERLTQLYKEGALNEAEFTRQKAAIISAPPRPAPSAPDAKSIPQPNQAKPIVDAPKKIGWGRWVLGIIAGVIVLNLLIPSTKSETGSSATPTSPSDSSTAGIVSESTTPTAPTSNWSYFDNADKMGSKYYTASIEANDLLNFKFPYNGGSTATLTVRRKNGSTDLYLQVSKGQFITKYDGGSVRIKFDNGTPHTYSTTGAADYSSDILFIDGAKSLVAKMKKSKKMIVEAEFYNEGSPQMEFDISGLKWTH